MQDTISRKENHDIFISYRREGGFETAHYFYERLTRDGYSVTFDIDALRNGRFDEALLSRIDECTDFIVILSRGCFDRSIDPSYPPENDWLRRELSYALEHRKNVIPIMLAGFSSFPANLPDDIRAVQLINGPTYVPQYIDQFYETLKRGFVQSRPSLKNLLVGCIVFFFVLALLAAAVAVVPSLMHRPAPPSDGNVRSSEETQTPEEPEPAPILPERGARWTIELLGGVELSFVPCPAGLFQMGSPESEPGRYPKETKHLVRISRPFWIGETEVTQKQWESIMKTTLLDQAQLAYEDDTPIEIYGKTGTNRDFNWIEDTGEIARLCGNPDGETAMYNVSWDDATNFCVRLTERERAAGRLPDGYVFRLPTEAEWEYAARAGSGASLPDGSDLDIKGRRNAPNLDFQAWYAGNSSVGFSGTGLDTSAWPEKQYPGGLAHVRRVRQKQPNAWGLYDTIGNVFEWCLDRYDFSDYSSGLSVDPRGPETGTHRILRGGSFLSEPVGTCRLANRRGGWPNRRIIDCGFRVALAPDLE